MNDTSRPFSADSFVAAFRRPVWVIMMVGQMLLGLALAIGLIMKFYMAVFGTAVCTPDQDTIANILRCTPTMVICAHFVMAAAAIRFAAILFRDDPYSFLGPLMIGVGGLFLLFMSGITPAEVSWSLAAVNLIFLLSFLAIGAARFYLRSKS